MSLILIVDDELESTLATLVAKYLKMEAHFGLQQITSSKQNAKVFNTVSQPTLILNDGTQLNSIQKILFQFSQTLNLDLLLFGETDEEKTQIMRHFDLCLNENFVEFYNAHMATRTYIEGNCMSIADFLVFVLSLIHI